MSPQHGPSLHQRDERTAGRKDMPSADSRLRRVAIAALLWLATICVLYVHLIIWPHRFQEGQLVPYTILAPIDYSYEDEEKLAELTGKLSRDEVLKEIDPSFLEQSLQRVDDFRREIDSLRRSTAQIGLSDPRAQQLINQLAEQYGIESRVIFNYVNYETERLDQLFGEIKRLINEQMDHKLVTAALIKELKTNIGANALVQPELIYTNFLLPNWRIVPDPDEGMKALAQVQVGRGQVIVGQGQTANQRVLQQLELDQVQSQLLEGRFYTLAGIALLLLGGFVVWLQYLRRFASHALLRLGALMQFGVLFIGFLALGLFIGRLPFNHIPFAVVFPVVCLSCIVVMVYDSMFAAFLGIGLAVVLSLALGYQSDLLVYTIGGALFPPVTLSAWSRKRIQVLFALVMGVYCALLALSVTVLSPLPFTPTALIIAASAGFGAAIVALGLLPVIETISSQLTPGKLTELANPENDLLKRMKREAHGTYAHSQMVADLAEEGCKEIRANALLARVGALYHDIGKLRRPGFFAENIHDLSKNPHIGLPAESSAKILKDHVTDGLAMAREARLPRELHHFISEHHGTYLIKYFYHQAVEQHKNDPVKFEEPDKAFFHYSGPVPHSRETAVTMLADVTEAVTRARGEMEEDELLQLLDHLFAEKIEEEQLIESQLTIGDLDKLKDAFARVLLGTMHHRVRYPYEIAGGIQFHVVDPNAATAEPHY